MSDRKNDSRVYCRGAFIFFACLGCILVFYFVLAKSNTLIIIDHGQVGAISGHQVEINELEGTGLEIRIEEGSDDPHINFYPNFSTQTADIVEIETQNMRPQELHLYWTSSSGCKSMSEDCRLNIPSSNVTGIAHARMSDHCQWKGNLNHFRIDFTQPGGSPFILKSIRFKSSSPVIDLPAAEQNGCENNSERTDLAEIAENDLSVLSSNMFELQLTELFQLSRRKHGGALGSTPTELIVVVGDGQLRVLNLENQELAEPNIELPANNEAEAVREVQRIAPESRREAASQQVIDRLRYDDILVFDDSVQRHLILSYGHFDPEKACVTHRLSHLAVSRSTALQNIQATANDWSLLFKSNPCIAFKSSGNFFSGQQSGGRVDVLDKEAGDIVLALGDYDFDGRTAPKYSQDLSVDYGKIIQINVHTKQQEIVSYGHRNPQGITVDQKGRIWSVEHGPMGGDELNLIEKGENYGWPHVTLGLEYGRRPWPFNANQGRHEGYQSPAFAWVPSIGVSNVDEVQSFHPFWDGDLLVFTLNGYRIERIRVDQDRVVFSERIDLPVQERIRYGMSHAISGTVFLWTDSGKLYRVEPSEQAWALEKKSRRQTESLKTGAPMQSRSEAELILSRCLECHSGGTQNPPDLNGIIGTRIARSNYTGYSDALKRIDNVWSESNLEAFLLDPQVFASGTSMPDQLIDSRNEARVIIKALKALGNQR